MCCARRVGSLRMQRAMSFSRSRGTAGAASLTGLGSWLMTEASVAMEVSP